MNDKRVPLETIEAIKSAAANSKHSTYWFDADTMRYFSTRVADYVIPMTDDSGSLFITSDKQDEESLRRYTVRKCDLDGEISTVGEFLGHKNMTQARNHAVVHAARLDACPFCTGE